MSDGSGGSRWLYGLARVEKSQRRMRIALSYMLAAVLGGVLWNWYRSLDAYTLYRSSLVIENSRIYIATFAGEGAEYNRENCQTAAELFQGQPGVKTRFWCEKGLYRR